MHGLVLMTVIQAAGDSEVVVESHLVHLLSGDAPAPKLVEEMNARHSGQIGKLDKGLPDVQRTLNWVHLASRYPVRVRVENPAPELFRVGESAVVTIRAN